MRKLAAFNFVTMNGFLNGPNGDISWHRHGDEENQYAVDSMGEGNVLVFGRKTYEMMASYWPSPAAIENDPTVAEGMNQSEKLVFSNTLKSADWENTHLVSGDPVQQMQKLKATEGNDMTILGSGSLVSLLASHDLVDEFHLMIDPVAIGKGDQLFGGIGKVLSLQLTGAKTFSSGVVLLSYKL